MYIKKTSQSSKSILTKKGFYSLEFLFFILLIIIVISLFLKIQTNLLEKTKTNLNYKEYNNNLENIKKNYLEKNNGELLINEDNKKSTNPSS